jgi:hypothetical protein
LTTEIRVATDVADQAEPAEPVSIQTLPRGRPGGMVRPMPQSSQPAGASAEFAVLTGDIIRSTRLSPDGLEAAMAALAAGAAAMSGWEGARPARFSRYRGDGWQCLAPSAAQALRAVLFLRASLKAIPGEADTRASVGIGPGVLPEGHDLAAASGPAFEVSGRGLDKMPRVQQLAIHWSSPPPGAPVVGAVFALCDEISRLWTRRQAEVLVETLSPGEERQQVLAKEHGVSQQAIAKRLSGGGDWALQRAMAALEADGA